MGCAREARSQACGNLEAHWLENNWRYWLTDLNLSRRCFHYLSWLFRASLCIAAYLSWHCWASFVSSQLRMAGHRRSSPGSAGLLCISFFCSVLYRFSFLLYYLSWHRRASRASLRILASLGIFRGIPGHRCASLGIAAFILL